MKVIPYGHSFEKRGEVLRCSGQTGSTVQAAGTVLMPKREARCWDELLVY